MEKQSFEMYIAMMGGVVDEIDVRETATQCEFTVKGFKVFLLVDENCMFQDFKVMTLKEVNDQVKSKAHDYCKAIERRDELLQQLNLKPAKKSLWRALWK
jgi:hypothetical protein